MNSKAFKRQYHAWLDHQIMAGVRDGRYPATAFLLAYQLATKQFNEERGGVGWPGCKTLGDAIGKSKATVINLVRLMAAHGDLRVEWGSQGSGHSNHYWMTLKPETIEILKGKKGQPTNLSKGQSAARKGQLAARKGQPADLNHLKNHPMGDPRGSPIGRGRERASRKGATIPPPASRRPWKGRAPKKLASLARKKRKQASKRTRQGKKARQASKRRPAAGGWCARRL
jgi:hypothetical protein